MHKWYVLQVVPGHEKKVKKRIDEALEQSGMKDFVAELLVPTENVSEVKKGEQRISEKRLWPGYILVKLILNDDSWSFLRNISGVLGFLGGEKPTPLSDAEVGSILVELEEKKKEVVQKHKVEVGDRVKIVDGVFVNFTGTVLEVFHDKGRLSVKVSIFGRDTRVDDLEFWQVEKLSPENE